MNIRRWVLLRGLVREQRHWNDFPEIFKRYFPNDQLVLHDFAGNGKRFREKSATSILGMVEDIRYTLASDSLASGSPGSDYKQHPVHIIALSLGAMVAAEWMIRYPDECAASVLISTSMKGLNPLHQRLLPSTYPSIIGSLLLPEPLEKKESRNLKLVSNLAADDETRREILIRQWAGYAREYPVSASNGLRQLIAAARFQLPDKKPRQPVLILRSRADHLVSAECSATLAEHWHKSLQTHETAGHDIPLDDADWVCRRIVEWLG
jgi:pimeloyl-ACP methyl ester carboxylesterase